MQAVNLKRLVTQLRKQRAGMVQMPEQYMFCYKAIAEELAEVLGPDGTAAAHKLPMPVIC